MNSTHSGGRHGTTIQVEQVRQAFNGAAALEDVSLQVEPGEFISLVGPSGCGKSTLLRLLAGLIEPTAGRVQHAGTALRQAFVFQDPTLLPWRTVIDNIALPLELAGVARGERRQRAHDSLAQIGLTSADAGKFPRELSGGMRMRVSLARALVTRPDLLLLDEPFAALDDLLRQQLNEELLRLWQEQRWTAVFVTHNVAEAVYLSQRVIVMSARPGRIVADVAVPFAMPRNADLRATPEFARLTGEVSTQLRQQHAPLPVGRSA